MRRVAELSRIGCRDSARTTHEPRPCGVLVLPADGVKFLLSTRSVRMKHLMLGVATAVALTGCLETEPANDSFKKALTAVSSAEAIGNSPDAAVKSWWRVKDAGAVLEMEVCKANISQAAPYFEKLARLSTEDVHSDRTCMDAPTKFDRQILKVDVQSDTRAVVTAQIRNVTPPEEGAVLDADDKEAKAEGSPFQYLVERKDKSSDWKIAQVSRYVSYKSSWESIFEKPEPSTNRWVSEWLQ